MVGAGGIVGAAARFSLGKWIADRLGTRYPWGTWIINISGSLLLGILYSNKESLPSYLYLLLGVGFCGAYTTFSTFGYETLQLMEKKEYVRAIMYVISSVILGLIGTWLGMQVR
nr:fluoride efflux transporter CrcB [Paenibacillus sediminis]